jgi:hypothetical protein
MKYDLVIVGAGPAGLMAAIRASELKARVLIIEKNKRPGIKLLTTGGGRCNFTNYITDSKTLAAEYEPNKQFLISSFLNFGVSETINFFEENGLKSKTEANGRVFPISGKADDVLNVLLGRIKNQRVEIRAGVAVKEIKSANNQITKLILDNGEEISGKNFILCTGGKSYPATGSSGDAYTWLRQLGHNIIKPRPALAPIHTREKFVKDLEGLSLNNIELKLFSNGKKIAQTNGDIIFTQNGLSGPAALNLSRFINFSYDPKYILELDLFPDKSNGELDIYLQSIFHGGNKLFKNVLEKITRPKMAPVLISLLKVNSDKQANSITKDEKTQLINLLKKLSFSVLSVGDFNQAMVTAGGVDLKEINPKTMQSKLISNLYLAGEIIDLSGPSGGFNLQLSWSTGYLAGESSVDKNIHS